MKDERAPTLLLGLDTGFRMLRWLVLLLLVLFCLSGITRVKSGEEALVLRLGKLVKVQPSGLLLALPYPIDDVIRVPVKQEGEVDISDFLGTTSYNNSHQTIDALREGSRLTGDHQVV